MNGMKKIESKLFHSLWRDGKWHHYYVMNDMNYLTDFWADSDEEALQIFRNNEY